MLAEKTEARSGPPAEGERWTQFRISDIEGGRADRRKRTVTPEELVALARVFDVPLFEFYMSDMDNPDEKIDMGGVDVRGADFFRLVFWIPADYRTITDRLQGGVDESGRPTLGSRVSFQVERFEEAMANLLESGEIHPELLDAFLDGDASAERAMLAAFQRELGNEEMVMEVFGSPRNKEWLADLQLAVQERNEEE